LCYIQTSGPAWVNKRTKMKWTPSILALEGFLAASSRFAALRNRTWTPANVKLEDEKDVMFVLRILTNLENCYNGWHYLLRRLEVSRVEQVLESGQWSLPMILPIPSVSGVAAQGTWHVYFVFLCMHSSPSPEVCGCPPKCDQLLVR